MSKYPENPPAFARSAYTSGQNPGDPFPHHEQEGMSLRDYFAAHCPITLSEFLLGWKLTATATMQEAIAAFARMRLDYADAMLTARKEPTNG